MNRQRVKCVYCGRERRNIEDACPGCGSTSVGDMGDARYLEGGDAPDVILSFTYGIPIYSYMPMFQQQLTRTVRNAS